LDFLKFWNICTSLDFIFRPSAVIAIHYILKDSTSTFKLYYTRNNCHNFYVLNIFCSQLHFHLFNYFSIFLSFVLVSILLLSFNLLFPAFFFFVFLFSLFLASFHFFSLSTQPIQTRVFFSFFPIFILLKYSCFVSLFSSLIFILLKKNSCFFSIFIPLIFILLKLILFRAAAVRKVNYPTYCNPSCELPHQQLQLLVSVENKLLLFCYLY